MNPIKSLTTNNIARNIFSLGFATLLSAALSFIIGIMTRNLLGPQQYGYYLSISLIFTFIPLMQLGTLNAMNREIPFYKARNQFDKVKEIKDLTLSFLLTVPTVSVILMFVISIILYFTNIENEYKIGFFYSSIISLLIIFSLYVEMYYKSEQNFRFASRLILIKSMSQSILTLFLVYLMGYNGLYLGMILGFLIEIFIGKTSFTNANFKVDGKKYKELIQLGFPIMLVGMVWSILIASDRLMITAMMSPEDLGNYGIGMLVFNSMMLLPQVIGQVYYPKIVEYISSQNYNELYRQYWKVNFFLAVGVAGIVLTLYFLFPWFVKVFLPEYTGGIKTGQILILGVYPLTLVGFSANYFNATKNQKTYIMIQIVTIFTNIFLSLIFLHFNFKITSIAWGTACSYFIYFLLMNYYFLKDIRGTLNK